MNLLRTIAYVLPAPVIRWLGNAQFKHPLLGKAIRFASKASVTGVGKIRRGVGAGLTIDNTLGFPGYMLGTTEPQEQQFLADNLKPGSVVYDVGANIGFHALLCSRLVGNAGSVYAFEPFKDCAEACRRNASLNDFKNITVHQYALSDDDGESRMDMAAESTAQFKLADRKSAQTDGPVVAIRRLDSVFTEAGLSLPNLIIIDVEGHELAVMAGAISVISQSLPTILCEVHWLGQGFINFVTEHLEPLGYSMANLDGGDVPTDYVRWHAVLKVAV